jgi:hypothetical protein
MNTLCVAAGRTCIESCRAVELHQQHCQQLTCTDAAQAAARRACGTINLSCGANTQARGGVAGAGVPAGAGLRCAVDVVDSAQICIWEDTTTSEHLCLLACANYPLFSLVVRAPKH